MAELALALTGLAVLGGIVEEALIAQRPFFAGVSLTRRIILTVTSMVARILLLFSLFLQIGPHRPLAVTLIQDYTWECILSASMATALVLLRKRSGGNLPYARGMGNHTEGPRPTSPVQRAGSDTDG